MWRREIAPLGAWQQQQGLCMGPEMMSFWVPNS